MRGGVLMKLTHVFLAPDPADKARKGQLCRIVCRGRGPGPHNVLIEFTDGRRMVTVRERKRDGRSYSLRRARDRDRQVGLFS